MPDPNEIVKITVEVGYKQKAYDKKYSYPRTELVKAEQFYSGLNTHSGYKKRMVAHYADGRTTVLARKTT